MDAILALEDGRIFRGEGFGYSGTSTGEACFNTSMTGYQEILTDPSYRGQIVAMTYPLIGNYGITPVDSESRAPHVRGFVIGELCSSPSNFRAQQALPAYLEEHEIIGIEGVDTRALTHHLRSRGAMQACLTTELEAEAAVEAARQAPAMAGADFVQEVTTDSPFRWEEESRRWTIPNPCTGQEGYYHELTEAKYHIVAYDFGIKFNILRRLRQEGFQVTVVNARTSAADILATDPDGIFLSNGPGDPAALDYIHTEIAQLIGRKPIFGICLGNQILSHAFGGKTFKLKFGHRGGNQPVKDLRTGKISITSQNHGFATDPESLPSYVEVTHMNLNDDTVEGIRSTKDPVFSVQYHPEAAPGPHDASYFFREFAELIEQSRS